MRSQKLTNVLLILVLGVLIYLCAIVRMPITVGNVEEAIQVTGESGWEGLHRDSPIDVNIVNEPDVNIVNEPLGVNVESLP